MSECIRNKNTINSNLNSDKEESPSSLSEKEK